jgi:multicomponent K+:H+ antiporter subunit D
LPAGDRTHHPAATLVRIGALLLLVVFAVKAAVLPLYFWLPQAYASASPPVAALFAIMTKVGVYAILRVFTLAFGVDAGPLAGLALPLLFAGGLLTLTFATVGVMASRTLRRLSAYLVIASVGTLLIGLGIATPDAVTAALYYLVHSTLALAALFLLADLIGAQRGELGDRIAGGPAVGQPALLGSAFFVGAVAVAGMPPLSGFLGKALLLRSALGGPSVAWVYAVVLGTSLLTLIALARAGSLIFWNTESRGDVPCPSVPAGTFLPVGALLALSALLVLGAGPFYGFFEATAAQLLDPGSYVTGVLGTPPAE